MRLLPGTAAGTDGLDHYQALLARGRAGVAGVLRAPAAPARVQRRALNATRLGAMCAPALGEVGPRDASVIAATSARRLGLDVGITHGDAHVSVPADFAWERTVALLQGADDVLEWDDTIKLLWSDLLLDARDAGISADTGIEPWWGYLFGCWNISMDGGNYLFFREYGGAPVYMLGYAFTMLKAYARKIDDHATGSVQGEGFGREIGRFFESTWMEGSHSPHHDEPGHRSQPWWHYVHALSTDADYTGRFTDVGPCSNTIMQSINVETPRGVPYDEEGFSIRRSTHEGFPYVELHIEFSDGAQGATWTEDSYRYDHVFHRADILAGSGRWADVLMFYAWLGVEYTLAAEDDATFWMRVESHFRPAFMLGRAVLRRALALARLHGHEMGHSFNGHGHCTDNDSKVQKSYFMEAALHPFTCGVAARLGLPWNEQCIPTVGPSDLNPNCGSAVAASTSVSATFAWTFCAITMPMTPGSSSRECSANWCSVDDYLSPECYHAALGTRAKPVDPLDRDCDAIVARAADGDYAHMRCGCATPFETPSGTGP